MNYTPFVSGDLEILLLLVFTTSFLCWLSSAPFLSKLFSALPLVVWVILSAAVLSETGVLPKQAPIYSLIGKVCLPLSLFYLIASCDVRGIGGIGKSAIPAVLAGALGVAVGGVLMVLLFARGQNTDIWQGMAVVAAGWIGGTANGVAVQQGINAPAETVAPLVLMQTFVGFAWLLFLLFLSRHQNWLRALSGGVHNRANVQPFAPPHHETSPPAPMALNNFSLLIATGFAALLIAGASASLLPQIGNPVIISEPTWVILIISAIAISASLSKAARRLCDQSTTLGYYLLYITLASLGVQLDFSALSEIGVYAVAGFLWLAIHFATLLLFAWLFKISPPMIAIGSMANIGGVVTAPLVASYYDKRLMPLALIMAIFTQMIGVYIPFALAGLFSFIANS
ncbi:MAG: DUF819 family protein [Pseudomonadota bacterium]